MYRPGRRLILLLALPALLALAVPWCPVFAFFTWGVFALIIGAAIAEGFLLRQVQLSVEAEDLHPLPIGEPTKFVVRFRCLQVIRLQVHVRQVFPLALGGKSFTSDLVLTQGLVLRTEIPVLPQTRGNFTLPPLALSLTRWGLTERCLTRVIPERDVVVIPDLLAIGRMHRDLDALFLRGAGQRLSPRLGSGYEFARLRDYIRGDDLRHISWKNSARRGKLIVQEFRVERGQDVVLCVDASARSAVPMGPGIWLDQAVDAALRLASLAERLEDRVGLWTFAHEVLTTTGQGRGPNHLRILLNQCTRLRPTTHHADLPRLATRLSRTLPSRSLIVFFLQDPAPDHHNGIVSAMRRLRPRHLPLVLLMDDRDLDARAMAPGLDRHGLATAVVAGELRLARLRLIQELRTLGVLVVEHAGTDLATVATNSYLDVKRRQLL